MGKAMLGLQGLLFGGGVCVLFVNLREGIEELKRKKEEEEGLGIVQKIERHSIYSVFFAVNLLSRLIRKKEAERAARKGVTVHEEKDTFDLEGYKPQVQRR
eukprot:767700-Hanusia_phi.AAC.1